MNDESVPPAKITACLTQKANLRRSALGSPPKDCLALREPTRRSLFMALSHLLLPVKERLLTQGRIPFFFQKSLLWASETWHLWSAGSNENILLLILGRDKPAK